MSSVSSQLRPARPTDLVALVTLERATETAPHWSPSIYAAILVAQGERVGPHTSAPQRCLIVADRTAEEDQSSLAGFAVGLMHPAAAASRPGERLAELESVVVAADSRRVGIGRSLCSAVIDWCRSRGATAIVLEVRSRSEGAIALYAGLGFVPLGRRPRYYRDPKDDALNMRLTLP
jgi:ribosomal-protein-alanine N-acetyltransferase